MGCESSLQKLSLMKVSILDPYFMKPQHVEIRTLMKNHRIQYSNYISNKQFFQEFTQQYTHVVIICQEYFDAVFKEMKVLKIMPKIYTICKNKEICLENTQSFASNQILRSHLFFVESYKNIIEILTQSRLEVKFPRSQIKSDLIQNKQKRATKTIDVKILKNQNNIQFSESMIFEQTLKAKNISFLIYESFNDFEANFETIKASFLVTDYAYHKEVIQLINGIKIKNNNHSQNNYLQNNKVICFCQFHQTEYYDPSVYFITNNFQQIANQITLFKNIHKNLLRIACNKVFLYSPKKDTLFSYQNNIEKFNFKITKCNSLSHFMRETRFYFCATLICQQQQKQNVETFLQKMNNFHRIKLLSINSETMQNNDKSLRKIIKQLKKGYTAHKGVTKSVDIIDKHHESNKFDEIKKELQKHKISYFCYSDINLYIKKLTLISPYVICNFQEKSLLARYLTQISSKANIIIFCNKSKIDNESFNQKRYKYVSNHFGKILKYMRQNLVYNPYEITSGGINIALSKINDKKEKIKHKQQRISVLRWMEDIKMDSDTCITEKQNYQEFSKGDQANHQNLSFINIHPDTKARIIDEMYDDNCAMWKLSNKPLQNNDSFQKFKLSLANSLTFLQKNYKIQIPQQQFLVLTNGIISMNFEELMIKVREFYESSNEFGLKINASLKNLSKISNEEIQHLREIIFLMNYNYVSYYQMPKTNKMELVCWTKEFLLEKCQIGTILSNKNYFIMYQRANICEIDQHIEAFHKIQVEIQYNALTEQENQINSYFKYKNKFIFTPFSQFIIQSIQKQINVTVIRVIFKKSTEFLNKYYKDNLIPDQSLSLKQFFKTNLSKIEVIPFQDKFSQKNIISSNTQKQSDKARKKGRISDITNQSSMKNFKNSFLICEVTYQQVFHNFLLLNSIKLFRQKSYFEAIVSLKQLLKRQEQLQNFDSFKISELQMFLGFYYEKAGNSEEALPIIKELCENDCGIYIIEECQRLMEKIELDLAKDQKINIEKKKKITQRVIQLKNELQNQVKIRRSENEESEASQKFLNNIFGENLAEVECMEINECFEKQEIFN